MNKTQSPSFDRLPIIRNENTYYLPSASEKHPSGHHKSRLNNTLSFTQQPSQLKDVKEVPTQPDADSGAKHLRAQSYSDIFVPVLNPNKSQLKLSKEGKYSHSTYINSGSYFSNNVSHSKQLSCNSPAEAPLSDKKSSIISSAQIEQLKFLRKQQIDKEGNIYTKMMTTKDLLSPRYEKSLQAIQQQNQLLCRSGDPTRSDSK